MKTWLLGLTLVAALCAVAPAAEDLVVRLYPVKSSDPSTLVETIRDVLSDKAKVAYYKPTSQIIVTATPEEQEVAAALMKEMNVPSRNIRLDVKVGDQTDSSEAGFSLNPSGRVVVTDKGTSYKVRVEGDAKARSGSSTSNTRQTLVMMNGKEGTIFVGQEVPYAQWLLEFGVSANYMQQGFEMRPIGASLVAFPQILAGGQLISVTLTPEISGLVEGHMERIRYTKVATQVTVADGATVTLGGFGDNKEFYEKFLVGVNSKGERRSVSITLTAHIQNPAGQNENGDPP